MTIIPVTIDEINQVTPTVKLLTLGLGPHDFNYKAGQWVDCYADIDGERKIVGYSIASSPLKKGKIEIAVKESDNPVTEYVHNMAHIGDTLFIDGGQGKVFYEQGMKKKVVLLGGGIGIAPLMGMLRLIDSLKDTTATMIQSASNVTEMMYYYESSEIAQRNQKIEYFATVTQEGPKENFMKGRINRKMLSELKIDLDSLFYICGPEQMIPELEKTLIEMGVPQDMIKYEVWWKPAH